jgi:hypothetical protein
MEPSPALSAYLDAWMDDDLADVPDSGELAIEDDVFADRLLYRRATIAAEEARIEKLRKERIAEIDDWCDRRKAKAEREASWIERGLEVFMRFRVARGGPKTLQLPSGVLKLTKPRESVDVRDPDGFRAWARANAPELLRWPEPPEPEPKKDDLKKLRAGESRPFGELLEFSLAHEGEVIPGVYVVVPKEDSFKAVPTERQS